MRVKKEIEDRKDMLSGYLIDEQDDKNINRIVREIRLLAWILQPSELRSNKSKESDKSDTKLQDYGIENPVHRKKN